MKKFLTLFIILLVISTSLFSGGTPEQILNQLEGMTVNSPSISTSSSKSMIATSNITSTLNSLNNLYRYLDQNFLYDIDLAVVDEELTKALITSLNDKYSYYIAPEDSEDYEEDLSGTYVGIGTYLTKQNPDLADFSDPETYMIQITAPFPGGPADRAGLRARDLISHINGEDISSLTANEASKKLKGEAGKTITLTVHRGTATFEISLMPEVVITPTVTSGIVADDIGYIAISQFSTSTSELMDKAIDEVIEDGATSLIIDLRNNGGGTVTPSLQIADMFISSGKIVTVKYKEDSGRRNILYQANPGVKTDVPVVILINGGTASASEILTGALKDNDRVTVIGSQSFGKGIMQDVIQWGEGYIQFTSAQYLTPSGESIHEIGITPDIVVDDTDYTDEEMASYEAFLQDNPDIFTDYIKEKPDYTTQNIEAFATKYESSGVPRELLCLLMRNEYVYSLDFNDRPVADLVYDTAMRRAVDFLKNGE